MATSDHDHSGNAAHDHSVQGGAVDAQELQKACEAVDRLCGLLGITSVVVVDDELTQRATHADLVGRCAAIHRKSPDTLKAIEELHNVNFDAPEDARNDLQEVWDDLSDEKRVALMAKLNWFPGESTFSTLRHILEKRQPVFLSLVDWKMREASLTSVENAANTLFLFDLDMQKEGGAPDEGMRLTSGLLRRTDGRFVCGILSHLVPLNSEYAARSTFLNDHDLSEHQGRFVVISKKYLHQSPMAFAQRLKRAAISGHCDALRERVSMVLDRALQEARARLDELNIYDFEEIVFQSSHVEGVWEPDTLLRILAQYMQKSTRELLQADTDIESLAAAVRNVVDIDFRPDDAPAPSSRRILRLELYENGEFLSRHHAPLEVGDIFQKTTGSRAFVLVAQPCDLMCRNLANGARPEEVLLAPIVNKPSANNTRACWPLPWYRDDGDSYVDFRNARTVPILALDLTVFGPDGASILQIDAQCPQEAMPSWRRRYAAIQKDVTDLLTRFANAAESGAKPASKDAAALAKAALLKSVPSVLSGELDTKARTISYDIKRVARLRAPRSTALLRDFAAYFARDGFEHDYSQRLHG